MHDQAPKHHRTLALCGTASTLAYAALAWQSHRTPAIWMLLGTLGIGWVALLGAWRAAASLTGPQLLPRLWIFAIALRCAGLLAEPVFEDDHFRFLWDGRQLALTGNPYDRAPREYFTDATLPDRFQRILGNINHPDVPTIYGPVCQFMFALSYWIAPGELWPLKALLIGADLLVLGLLLRLVAARHALLYAWCPLIIHETAFNAHPEILGVAALVAGLWTLRQRHPAAGALLCAVAVAARIHAVLLVPFLLWPVRGRTLTAFVLGIAVLYAPFWAQGSTADLAGLRTLLGQWEFNSSLFGVTKELAGWAAAKGFCTALLVLGAAILFLRFTHATAETIDPATNRTVDFMTVVLALFLACSAVVNPWYLLWLPPLFALRPSLTLAVALAAVSLSYIHGGTISIEGLAPYHHPKWLRPLEYGLILAVALFENRKRLFPAKRQAG